MTAQRKLPRLDERGVAAMEFALILPLLLALLAGIMEYGRVLMAEHAVRDIIDQYARQAVVEGLGAQTIEDSVSDAVAEVRGIADYDVDVDDAADAVTVTVEGSFELLFGTILPVDAVSFSFSSRMPK